MGLPEALGVEAARAAGHALTRPRAGGPELTAIALSDLPVVNPWFRDDSSIMVETKYGPNNLPLGALTSFRVYLANTGNEALIAEKFQRPIEISFAEHAALQRMSVRWRRHAQFHPDDDPITINETGQTIAIKPALLNPGDALIASGIVAATASIDPRVSVRYPGLPIIEALHLSATDTDITFENFDLEVKKTRWVALRKFLPKRFRYQRAAQLRDAIDLLLHWDERK